MASEWELGMGVGFGYGVGPTANSPTYLYGLPSTDTLRIDDLLDLSSCHDKSAAAAAAAASVEGNLIPKQEGSEFIGGGHFVGEYHSVSNVSSFADDIYVPSEEAAELEWLSKFMEDSFTDAPYPSNYSRSYTNTLPAAADAQMGPTNTLPGRGGPRTKRSRAAAAAASSSTSSSSSSDFTSPAQISIPRGKSSASSAAAAGEADGGVRRCTHCASEKTPQWRTGPMGPKTLCNACGVRYKSGRLVPEYRPAASPTFVLTQHSNSHRKVMELRRQKEQIHVLRRDQLIG